MSVTLVLDSPERPPTAAGPRLGQRGSAADGADSTVWLFKRNCSISPRQSLACFAGLASVSLGIGTMFWWQGAPFVMPFAGLELMVVASLWLMHARHVTDRETLRLSDGRLVVESVCGPRVERIEFTAGRVRVDAGQGFGSLVTLSGEGRQVRVGAFVRPERRCQLADELRGALRHVPDIHNMKRWA